MLKIKIIFLSLIFLVGSGVLLMMLINQPEKKTMALVGTQEIWLKDIQYQIEIDQCYQIEAVKQEVGLIELINQSLEKQVLKQRFQVEAPEHALQKKSSWIDKNTKAPEILKCIKDVFGTDKKSYLDLYVSPTLVNPKLHSLFSLSLEIHQAEIDKIKDIQEEFKENKKDLKNFKEYQEWEIEKQEPRVPDILKEVHAQFRPNPLIREVLEKLKLGEVWPKIIEDDYSFKIVRLVKEDKDKYYLEGVIVEKRPFDGWFQQFVKQNIEIKIINPELKQRILLNYPDLWWLGLVK